MNICEKAKRFRMLVLEKKERGLVVKTKVFQAYDCGVLEAIEYVLREYTLSKSDKLKFIQDLLERIGGEIRSSKEAAVSYKFYYLP